MIAHILPSSTYCRYVYDFLRALSSGSAISFKQTKVVVIIIVLLLYFLYNKQFFINFIIYSITGSQGCPISKNVISRLELINLFRSSIKILKVASTFFLRLLLF